MVYLCNLVKRGHYPVTSFYGSAAIVVWCNVITQLVCVAYKCICQFLDLRLERVLDLQSGFGFNYYCVILIFH